MHTLFVSILIFFSFTSVIHAFAPEFVATMADVKENKRWTGIAMLKRLETKPYTEFAIAFKFLCAGVFLSMAIEQVFALSPLAFFAIILAFTFFRIAKNEIISNKINLNQLR